MPILTYTETLETTSCWCGINLAVPGDLIRWARDDERNHIVCPLGHKFVFSNTLREQLVEEQQRRIEAERRAQATRELLDAEERSHAATRGHLTRQKKRASAGTCPCCKRTFQQLARHMQTKHPDFVAEARS